MKIKFRETRLSTFGRGLRGMAVKASPPLQKVDFRQKNGFLDKHMGMMLELSTLQIRKDIIESLSFLWDFRKKNLS